MNRKQNPVWSLGFSLVFGLGWASLASAVDPRLPMLDEEPNASEKVARFEKAYADSPSVLGALSELSKADEVAARERIHRALLAIPAYAAAYKTYEVTPDETSAWEAIARDEDQDLFVRAHATYFLGRALLAQDDLEGAAEALEAVRGRLRAGTPWTDEATLYLAYVHARLAEFKASGSSGEQSKARARTLLTTLSGEGALFSDAPERVVEGADWLLRELRGDGMGPLLELAKRMETIERLIRRSRTGEGTQKRQEQVVVAIDKLIELMREKEKKGGGSCDKPGGKPKPGAKPGAPKGQKKGGAKESKLAPGETKEGDLAEAPRRADKDAWSDLKPKERERAAQFLKERFPSRYRELIERYYRGVAELDK